jgi:predicted permease
MSDVFEQLSILYIFLVAGWFIGKLKKEKATHSDILSVLLVNIFLPCKVFGTFANNFSLSYFKENITLPLSALILLTVLALFSHFASKLLTKKTYERKVYTYSFTVTNYAYLGYALIGSVFGEKVLSLFMLFAIPFIIYTYTVGYALLTGGKNPIKKLINPITAAIVLGLAVGIIGIPLPTTLKSAVSMASACVGPLSMILTGITLSAFVFKELIGDKATYVFCALRLVVIPGIVYGLCRAFHLDTLTPMMLIITCMPCGLNTIVFPKLIGEDCKPGARLALLTHIFSIVTIPCWLSLIF